MPDLIRTPTLSPDADAELRQPLGDLAGRLVELGIGEYADAAVDGQRVRARLDDLAEDVHERAR